jgi:hypothetical protein
MSTTKRADEISSKDLTAEQTKNVDLLNEKMRHILDDFDKVLAQHGIERQVYQFTTVRTGFGSKYAREGCMMACCACGPPDEACIGDCPACSEVQ